MPTRAAIAPRAGSSGRASRTSPTASSPANLAPDHSTIAEFRCRHERPLGEAFSGVLGLCARAGLATIGSVAIDGTKMAANASSDANRDVGRIAREILAEAADIDRREDGRFRTRRRAARAAGVGDQEGGPSLDQGRDARTHRRADHVPARRRPLHRAQQECVQALRLRVCLGSPAQAGRSRCCSARQRPGRSIPGCRALACRSAPRG